MTVCEESGALWVQVAGDPSAQDPATCDTLPMGELVPSQ